MKPDAASAASAMDPLDLLIEFFEDGKRWITGEVATPRATTASSEPWATFAMVHPRYYLLRAMSRRRINDV
jgi:hypothetical protein